MIQSMCAATLALVIVGCSSAPVAQVPLGPPIHTVMSESALRALVTAGGDVDLPAGSIDVQWIIHVPANTRIHGVGTTIYATGQTGIFELDGAGSAISDLTVDGTFQPSSGYHDGLIDVYGDNALIERVEVQNSAYFGVWILHVANPRVLDSTFAGTGRLDGGGDALGGGEITGALYQANTFRHTHGTAIDNCRASFSTWRANASDRGSFVVDGGSHDMLLEHNAGHVVVADQSGCGAPPYNVSVVP